MDELNAEVHLASGSPGARAIRCLRRLQATRAALVDETRRREKAHCAWTEEVRRHGATLAALAEERQRREEAQAALRGSETRREAVESAAGEVVRAARGVLGAGTPVATGPAEPVAARLASVLEVVATPIAVRPDAGNDAEAERARRFERVRARLLDGAPSAPPPGRD